MNDSAILAEQRDGVLVLTLNRPEVLNSFTRAMARDWASAQKTLCKHVQDCVDHIVGAGLLGDDGKASARPTQSRSATGPD